MTRSDLDARVVRAAARPGDHGQESWQTEAAAPDADEQPRSRMSPSGPSRPRRLRGHRPRRPGLGDAYDRIVAKRCTRLEDDQTLLVQSGKPVGVFRTHTDAPRVLIANSNLVPRIGRRGTTSTNSTASGLMMYGQMTAGSWIYIGTPGDRPGHLRDVRRDGPAALRGRASSRALDPDRRPGRHGRCPTAGGDDGRGVPAWPLSAGRSRIADAAADALPRRAGREIWKMRWPDHRPGLAADKPCRCLSALLGQCGRGIARTAAARRPPRCRDRSDIGPRPAARLSPRRLVSRRNGRTEADGA